MQEALHRVNAKAESLQPFSFVVLVPLVFGILDRTLKFFAEGGIRHELIGDLVVFDIFRNEGIAFSLPFSGPVLWTLSILIVIWVAWIYFKDASHRYDERAGWFLVFLVGAISNLYDRVTLGYVTDYLIFFQRSALNLADVMIVVGIAGLLFRRRVT